jgi:hypothetical protein
MAKEYDNTNTGTLGRAKERPTPKHPEFTGTLNVEGREYFLNAWVRTAKSGPNQGGSFFSLSVKAKEPRNNQWQQANNVPHPDSGIPF